MPSRVYADPFTSGAPSGKTLATYAGINGGAVLRIPTPTVTIHSDTFSRSNTEEGAGIGSPTVGNAYTLAAWDGSASAIGKISSNAFTTDTTGSVYCVSQYQAASIPTLLQVKAKWIDMGSGSNDGMVGAHITQAPSAGSVLGSMSVGFQAYCEKLDHGLTSSTIVLKLPSKLGGSIITLNNTVKNASLFPLEVGVEHTFDLIIPADGSAIVLAVNGEEFAAVNDYSGLFSLKHWIDTSSVIRVVAGVSNNTTYKNKATITAIKLFGCDALSSDGVYTPKTAPGIIT